MEVIDAHYHIGDLTNVLGKDEGHESTLVMEEEQRLRVGQLTEAGISWAVVQPSHGYLKSDGLKDTMLVNDVVAQYHKLDPVHFPIALGTVEPSHGERSLPEIDRVKYVLGLDGLSWHHRFQGCFIDNKWMWPILRRVADLKLVPFVHASAESNLESPWRLQRLALEFPEITFVALDAFFSYERTQEVMHLAERTPNIIWDAGGPSRISVEQWVRHHGSERLVFSRGPSYAGRSMPGRPILLASIVESNLSDQDKANILGANIRRLFEVPDRTPSNVS